VGFPQDRKTGDKSYGNMAIEMLPLFTHYIKWRYFKIECLYIYRNSYFNHDVGFWIKNLDKINIMSIYFPSQIKIQHVKQRGFMDKYYKDVGMCFKKILKSNCSLRDSNYTQGSQDPFCLINSKEIEKLKSWKVLINDLLNQKEGITQ